MAKAPQLQGYRRLGEEEWSGDSTLEADFDDSAGKGLEDRPSDDDFQVLDEILNPVDNIPCEADDEQVRQAQNEFSMVCENTPQNAKKSDSQIESNQIVQAPPRNSQSNDKPGQVQGDLINPSALQPFNHPTRFSIESDDYLGATGGTLIENVRQEINEEIDEAVLEARSNYDHRKRRTKPVIANFDELERQINNEHSLAKSLNQSETPPVEADKYQVGSDPASLYDQCMMAIDISSCKNSSSKQQNNMDTVHSDEDPQAQNELYLPEIPNQPAPIQIESKCQEGSDKKPPLKRTDSTELQLFQAIRATLIDSCKKNPMDQLTNQRLSACLGELEEFRHQPCTTPLINETQLLAAQPPEITRHVRFQTEALIHYFPSENRSYELNNPNSLASDNICTTQIYQAHMANEQDLEEITVLDEHDEGERQQNIHNHDLESNQSMDGHDVEPQHKVDRHDQDSGELLEVQSQEASKELADSTKTKKKVSRWHRIRNMFKRMRKIKDGFTPKLRDFHPRSLTKRYM